MSKKLCRIFVLLGFLAAFTSSALACRPVLIIILGFEDNTYGFQEVYENFPSSGITGHFKAVVPDVREAQVPFREQRTAAAPLTKQGTAFPRRGG